jgi:hypothetical protein
VIDAMNWENILECFFVWIVTGKVDRIKDIKFCKFGFLTK